MPSRELSLDKTYQMQTEISERRVDGKILIIAVERANWLVFDNEQQKIIFDELSKGKAVGEIVRKYNRHMADVLEVLKQIEGKRFAEDEVHYAERAGMYIYLTNRCNESCKHCYMYAGKAMDNELTTTEITRILQEFSDFGGQVVTFTGGEATIRKDFFDIAAFAKMLGLKVCLLTNGLLLNQEYAKKLSGCIDEVQISIDGYDRESYTAVRQVDGFDKALRAVEFSVEEGIRTTVAITPLPETLEGHENDYCQFADNLRKKYANKPVYIKFSKGIMAGRAISLSREENESYKHKVQSLLKVIKPFSEEKGFAADHSCNTGFVNCGYGWPSIAANGDVFACNLISECKKQGNIRKEEFSKIWDRLKKVRKITDIQNIEPCKRCDLRLLCGGGCRIKNFSELVQLSGLDLDDPKIISKASKRTTECSTEYKMELIRLMIRADKYFYR